MKKKTGNVLLIAMLIGIALGALVGVLQPKIAVKCEWIGAFFVDALKMMIAPLILTTLVAGMISIGGKGRLGKFGALTVAYFLTTTLISVILGMLMVTVIEPGTRADLGTSAMPEQLAQQMEGGPGTLGGALIQMTRNMTKDSIMGAMVNLNVIEIIAFSFLLGAVLIAMGEKAKPLSRLFEAGSDAMVRLIGVILWLAPVGVFALIGNKIGSAVIAGKLIETLQALGLFMATVTGALAIHTVILALILRFVGGRSPGRYAAGVAPALLTAFSSASSSATLPITMDCSVERNKVSRGATGFVLPLGATVNMDGTAMYEAVAVIFMAQAFGMSFTFTQMVTLCVTATVAGIGAAGIPHAGLVTMVIVVHAVGLPEEAFAAGLGLIFVVDWFLDRCRTTVNVWGDVVGAAVVDRLTGTDPNTLTSEDSA